MTKQDAGTRVSTTYGHLTVLYCTVHIRYRDDDVQQCRENLNLKKTCRKQAQFLSPGQPSSLLHPDMLTNSRFEVLLQ